MSRKIEEKIANEMEKIAGVLKRIEEDKDEILKLVREIIACSSRSIEASKRGDEEKAEMYLEKARSNLMKCYEIIKQNNYGYKLLNIIADGEKEFVEAAFTFSLMFDKNYWEMLKDLEIDPYSKLLGILEFSGEVRRIFIEKLLEEETQEARKLIDLLDKIYQEIVCRDIRYSLIPGLKRRLDILRNQIEKCLEDLNLALRFPRKVKDERED